jgi:hypothetical protein
VVLWKHRLGVLRHLASISVPVHVLVVHLKLRFKFLNQNNYYIYLKGLLFLTVFLNLFLLRHNLMT